MALTAIPSPIPIKSEELSSWCAPCGGNAARGRMEHRSGRCRGMRCVPFDWYARDGLPGCGASATRFGSRCDCHSYPPPMSKIESKNRISVDLKFATPFLNLHLPDIRYRAQIPLKKSVGSKSHPRHSCQKLSCSACLQLG